MPFNAMRIINKSEIPTIYCHGPRRIEFLEEDNLVRIWICEDQPVTEAGLPPTAKPVAILVAPMSCYVWNMLAQVQHGFDKGIFYNTKPRGPVELRPPRILMT